jgi:esterase/lipase superfamily enzyme
MAATIKVYFATNRDYSPNKKKPFGERFHKDGPQFYRVGMADVKKVSDDWDEGYRVDKVTVAKEKAPSAKGEDDGQAGSGTIFEQLRAQMAKDKRDVLVYLHGFANTFENGLMRAAQLKQQYLIRPRDDGEPYEPHVFMFSWPSNGRTEPPWEYSSDRDDAGMSGLAMARGLQRLLDFLAKVQAAEGVPCRQRIHLVAHSMGNWALRHAVLGLCQIQGAAQLPKIFDNVFLMAADEDDDTLESRTKLGALLELARAVHVYHSSDDLALMVSDTTKMNPDRLGTLGPRNFSSLGTRVKAIDCTKVNGTKLAHGNHQYYRIRPEVISDVRLVLAGRLSPEEMPTRELVEPNRRYRIPFEGG